MRQCFEYIMMCHRDFSVGSLLDTIGGLPGDFIERASLGLVFRMGPATSNQLHLHVPVSPRIDPMPTICCDTE